MFFRRASARTPVYRSSDRLEYARDREFLNGWLEHGDVLLDWHHAAGVADKQHDTVRFARHEDWNAWRLLRNSTEMGVSEARPISIPLSGWPQTPVSAQGIGWHSGCSRRIAIAQPAAPRAEAGKKGRAVLVGPTLKSHRHLRPVSGMRRAHWIVFIVVSSFGAFFVLIGSLRWDCMVGLPPVPTVCVGPNPLLVGLGVLMLFAAILVLLSGRHDRSVQRASA